MRFAVCDDEIEIRKDIAQKIRLLIPNAAISEFSSGNELIDSSEIFDIIFLDIEMSGIDGMQTARELRKMGSRSVVIFVTAFSDRVFEAFDVNAFNFLVKPVSAVKFYEVLKRAEESLEIPPSTLLDERYITIKSGGVSTKLSLSEIYYAEIFNRIIMLHTIGGNIKYYGKISELEECVGSSFFRCHRSYLINLRYIDSYTSSDITLSNGDKVVLAKKRYSDLVKAYMKFIKTEGLKYV